MITQILGYPRIGEKRELKKACEAYWAGKISQKELFEVSKNIKKANWEIQKKQGIDLIPSNDFSFYDQVLDMTLTLGAIPERFEKLVEKDMNKTDLYFAMARGYQKNGLDIIAMEMTKWFNTNYHYIVPEFKKNQNFEFSSSKIIDDYKEALELGIKTKPVLIGPVSFLLLGKEKEEGFDKLELINNLIPAYISILKELETLKVDWIQIDEPFLTTDLSTKEKEIYAWVYNQFATQVPSVKLLLTSYFDGLKDNAETVVNLPVAGIHLDLTSDEDQLDEILNIFPPQKFLSLGLVNGRNVWKNSYKASLSKINTAAKKLGGERIIISTSCSLLHTPYNLDNENDIKSLPPEIKNRMAFAKQKITELSHLKLLADPITFNENEDILTHNNALLKSRDHSTLIHKPQIKNRVKNLTDDSVHRKSTFAIRQKYQKELFNFPLFPTTTIGSFPQTPEVRKKRNQLKKGEISLNEYNEFIKNEIKECIQFQEEIDLDVLVHGEFERNDMVEFFGEQLDGFAFTQNGWVQSYGSRAVKPPIIYGDVERKAPMTVNWSAYAQSLTKKHVKGMLTGPITILQWSFVRDDQPRKTTAFQIALAIRDEVSDLEKAGIHIIQIDEPAIREGLPLRAADKKEYLSWAVQAFKISSSGVKDSTQIHTHMCYSEFNEIIEHIAQMDADVITIETSRSHMELLEVFKVFKYPNEIGPGVYDIHSPRVPTEEEMEQLIQKASSLLSPEQIWVNPDCGLKTRNWEETMLALKNMVNAAKNYRRKLLINA
ncbi:5-methyltetrahydropteroyltriglutamate--homocysteine S-methyltransferase [Abyssalbus ytuae]|uniref:5-methyltetrahydropteroyltriglutamate--homocysteine methyltransferase n=1 Tax=Abyssalbus ytuae TaxID=2926907 RepID=A0A9E6ZNL3_9FLAO|nr:5-methyltetrahydropteroyltriglutamate--homocysteine S-methyltransferase [Abyssalbus ytuae]UOB19244.1 5-methyltetrahydropteroyltriglutamate--homocysteine S-methyltransferase [Abyssalbus ytuae]